MYSDFSASVVWARIPVPAEATVSNANDKTNAAANLLPFISVHRLSRLGPGILGTLWNGMEQAFQLPVGARTVIAFALWSIVESAACGGWFVTGALIELSSVAGQ
jgi:hypothetical protein